ncbi:MAG: trigger factor [Spirochaetaceae bacterium]|nr:trigger factor [Spirochaetaceae bacterium]MBR4826177.1 trigger factor [Spirochaetaceae bacterium]
MNVTKNIKKIEHSAVELTVTIPQADVAGEYRQLLAKYAKSVQIPGFRKGHVPTNILERKFGESLKGEAVADVIEKALGEIFEEEGFQQPLPYSQPSLKESPDLNIDKDLTFTVVYDVMPEVADINMDGIEVEVPSVTVGEAELKEELKAIQERNALVVDKKDDDAAAKDDIATINYCELDKDGKTVAGTEREDYVFTIGAGQTIFEIDDDVIGMKKGETKEVTKKYKKDHPNEELAGQTKKIKVTLTALKLRNLPELDDELAQDVNEKFKTLDDLKADIKKNLNSALENRLNEIKTTALIEKLVEKNPIDLPASMCEAELNSRWRMMARQFQTTTEQLEKIITSSGQTKDQMLSEWKPDVEKALKGRIIIEKLLKDKNITVADTEVEAEYEKIAENASISVEEVKKHYADAQSKEYLVDDLKEQKLYKELFEKIKVKKGEKKAFADLFKK